MDIEDSETLSSPSIFGTLGVEIIVKGFSGCANGSTLIGLKAQLAGRMQNGHVFAYNIVLLVPSNSALSFFSCCICGSVHWNRVAFGFSLCATPVSNVVRILGNGEHPQHPQTPTLPQRGSPISGD